MHTLLRGRSTEQFASLMNQKKAGTAKGPNEYSSFQFRFFPTLTQRTWHWQQLRTSEIGERMDVYTSNPALLANSELFKRYIGRRVRTVVKVGRFEGGNLYAQAPDGPQIAIRQVVKNEDFTQYVEVIGVVEGDNALRAEICTNFGDKFDLGQFNTLCQMANGAYQDIFCSL